MKNDASYTKTMRLKNISATIAKGFNTGATAIDVKRTLAAIQYNVGLSKNKALEYLELCCDVHGWELKNGSIVKVPV